MALRNVAYQQHQQQYFHRLPQQQHPLLAAAAGNNYASYVHPRGHLAGHVNSFRPLAGAGSSASGAYAHSAPSGYGGSSSGSGGGGGGYDYHPQGSSGHMPTGYHASAGSGYAAPAPSTAPATKKWKQGGSSAMTALTLLSFFFFVNLLQGCLKDHVEAMNPTVMVMTAGVVRKSNKLAEMNSREQTASPASFTSGASIVMKPSDLVVAGSSLVTAATDVHLQSPYRGGVHTSGSHGGGAGGGGGSYAHPPVHYSNNSPPNRYSEGSGNNHNHNNRYHNNHPDYEPSPEFYDAGPYPNHTLVATTSVQSVDKRPHHYHHEQEQRPYQSHSQPQDEPYPWSHAASSTASTYSHSTFSHRPPGGSSYSSWATRPGRIGGSSYFDDNGQRYADSAGDRPDDDAFRRHDDTHYTRIN